MCQNEETLPPLYIQEPQKECFKKIVDYYFPGEWVSFISEPFPKHQSSQIEKWLIEDGVCGYLYILYRVSRDVWKVSEFYAICDNKGAIITVVLSSDGFIIGVLSDEPWKFYGGYYDYDKDFLFSLKSL